MSAPLLGVAFLGAPPAALAALFGAAGAALVALYLLRMKRRRVVVPFAPLWARVLGEQRTESLWRRLKRLISLLLQLLILALLVIALGDPRPARGERARTVAVLVDASASMQASDEAPKWKTRLDKAKHEARELVMGLGAGDLATVIRLDAHPIALGGLESDERELIRRVESIESVDAPADVAAGLRLAADVLRGQPNPTIVLISDGAGAQAAIDRAVVVGAAAPGPGQVSLKGIDVRYLRVGRAGDNIAVVGFSVRRYRQNKASYEVLLDIESFRDQPTPARLELVQDGEVVDVERITLGPRERAQRFLPNLAGAGTRLEARLLPDAGSKLDALPVDDRAFAVLAPRRKQKVLVVTTSNLFLEGALLLNENLQIDTMSPSDYDAARAAEHDVVVLDAFTPPEPPDAAALYLDPRGPSSPFRVVRDDDRVFVTEVAEKHPLMRWVTLADLNVARASVFALVPGDVALASSLRAPILVARDAGPRSPHRMMAVGFDVRRSDLPLRVGFPVLLVNAFDWFAGDEATLEMPWRVGETWRIPVGAARAASLAREARGPSLPAEREGRPREAVGPSAGSGGAETAEVVIQDPTGRSTRAPVVAGKAHYEAARVGFHRVTPVGAKEEASSRILAANLADRSESEIRPAERLTIGGAPLAAPSGFRRGLRRELWAWFVLAALALSLVEWWTWHRRVTV